ncbi:asparagine synthase-related protein [Enterococcus sp.]|uniref:asparagine synthase C-terminal domain-containing protein n=1 Tax=Enterococcus sp. TaxID=35783 RepID=UPI00289CC0F8|nr:asparagine synthase-related protein [Enterococcus sp.]
MNKDTVGGNAKLKKKIVYYDGNILNIKEVYQKIHSSNHDLSSEEMILSLFNMLGLEFFNLCIGDFIIKISDEKKQYICKGPTHRLNGYYEIINNNVQIYKYVDQIPNKNTRLLSFEKIRKDSSYALFFNNVDRLNYHEVIIFTCETNKLTKYPLSDPRHEIPTIFQESVAKDMIHATMTNTFEKYFSENKEKVISLVSGGIDSSIATYHANEMNDDLNLVSLGTTTNNEFKEAQQFGNFLKKEVFEIVVKEEEYLEVYPLVVYLLEHFNSQIIEYMIPVVLVYKKMQGRFKELISGYGSDILFGGFSHGESFSTRHLILNEYESLLYSNEMSKKIDEYFAVKTFYPFFETKFIHDSFKISSTLKTKNNVEKYILRKTYENCFPKEISWRKKLGIHEGSGCEKFFSSILEYKKGKQSIRYLKDKLAYSVFRKIFIENIPLEKLDVKAVIDQL